MNPYLRQYGLLEADLCDRLPPNELVFLPNHSYALTYNGANALDPRLDTLSMYDSCGRVLQGSLDFANLRSTYDPVQHGFHLPSQRHDMAGTYRTGVSPTWHDIDAYRHERYDSPGATPGLAMSSTASSISDHILSPELTRNQLDFNFSAPGQGYYGSPQQASPVVSSSWLPEQSLARVLPSSPDPMQRTVSYNPRDLQLTPDPEMIDEPMDDKDTLGTKLPLPEEIEYMDVQADSPRDSGIGQSEHGGDNVKDDAEDSGVVDSDNDSEFVPGGRSRLLGRRPSAGRHNLRKPRLSSTTTTTTTTTTTVILHKNSRVHKREVSQGTLVNNSRAKAKKQSVNKSTQGKSFPCIFHHYGCRATFANKNEWKRHVASQHLQLGFYRCDMGNCDPARHRGRARGHNDFNRKDLFTQHCRRMHAPWVATTKNEDQVDDKEKNAFEAELEKIRSRCWIDKRAAPASSKCGFCTKVFDDSAEGKAWEDRMEHVGRHFERDGCKAEQESVDEGLKQWALDEGLLTAGKKGKLWLVGFEPATATRGPSGRRRSKRTAVQEEAEEEGADAEDEIVVARRDPDSPVAVDDDDIDTDMSPASQTAAETGAPTTMVEDDSDDSDMDAEGEDE